jgi:dihydroorotase
MLIKNAQINGKKQDILIKNGKIAQIADSIEGSEFVDAKGALALPGLIDLNVRLKNDTLNQKNLESLSSDCVRGGITTALIIPDFTPTLDNESFLELLDAKLSSMSATLLSCAPLVGADDKLNNIATLIQNGASALWCRSYINSNLLRRGAQYAKMKSTPLLLDCYDHDLDDNGVMNEGEVAYKMGLPGISKVSETSEVAKLCEIAEHYDACVIFDTLSTSRSVELIRASSPKSYAQISIHHLLKNDTACNDFNTHAKLRPPLRDEAERAALMEALRGGKIDLLSSSHSPRSILYKDVAFEEAAYGIHAASDFLALAYTYLIAPNLISLERFIEMSSATPAKIMGLNKGRIEEGYDADIVLYDTNATTKITAKDSIYSGETLQGKVAMTIAKGEIVYR